MSKTASFQVYNASAGSGKTFTIVKSYLKLLLQANRPDHFRNILALTFTNKAVSEMKTRIIDTLKQFSDKTILNEPNSMFMALIDELDVEPLSVHENSKKILDTILHNYASFDISTIDRFTHKVIRTFAFDLKIPVNFEVELDTDSLLSEAVDSLIAKAGTDKELTKVLVDFAIEKTDDDKSWDISFDFNKIAKHLVNENDIPNLGLLKDKTLQDFKELKLILVSKIAECEKSIVTKAIDTLDFIEECGLQFDDFTRSSLPKHFENLSRSRFDIKFENNWQVDIENTSLYPSRVSPELASTIDAIKPQLVNSFNETKHLVFQYKFYKNFYKNLTPLSVLNSINGALESIKEEKNLILISEFNKIIHKEIKNQPTPFIYERLGEKFRHYFIDEFQDTSELQWENLIPLIDNRISSELGSAMIVGDAKQSIYRWRGGKPELFMGLYTKTLKPFMIEQEVKSLDFNYRSCTRVVEFNNSFFKHISSFVFEDDTHKALYSSANQETYLKEEGYVNIEFLEFDEGDERDLLYPESVLRTIHGTLSNGFELRDICVLVRKKKEGVAIADFLTEQGIDIISSETLLIDRSPLVQFANNVLKLSTQPENKEIKVDVLLFITEFLEIKDKHAFIRIGLDQSLNELSKTLNTYTITFDFNRIPQLSNYDAAEYIIRSFNLIETSDANIQYYLDTILDHSLKQSSSISDFLAYWDSKKDTLSISSPQGANAVQIMTIHKSKGLEFPVVIFPYADLNIYREKEPKIWYPLEKEAFNGFSHTLLNYNKDIAQLGAIGEHLYSSKQSELELDNINLLYVTLTRAVEQLHIITKKNEDSKGNENLKDYSGLFINFLKSMDSWPLQNNSMSFGNPKKQLSRSIPQTKTVASKTFISDNTKVNIVTNSAYLWDTEQELAIEKGNLIHDIISKIKTEADINFVLNDAYNDGLIHQEQKNALTTAISAIVNHPKLREHYTNDVLIYNERDIISSTGTIIRPDRLVIDKNNIATIIDYKTGAFDKKHEQQLITYADIIETMSLKVDNKILVYINDEITVKEI